MKYNLDELLEIASAPVKRTKRIKKGVSIQERAFTVRLWLEECDIKAGEVKVPNFIIYYHYCQHLINHKKHKHHKNKKMKYRSFMKFLGGMFEKKRHGNQRFHMLDATPFDLSREGILTARHYCEQKVYKKEKNKKRKNARAPKSVGGVKCG